MAEAIAIVAAAVAMLGVLVPLLIALHGRTERRIDAVSADLAAIRTELRDDMAEVRHDVAEVRRDLRDQGERVARIEAALTGPWRPPANGPPAPAPVRPETSPETAAS